MADLLSIPDAAERLGLSSRRVRALVESGKLPADRIGSRYVVSRSDLGRYQRSRSPAGRPISGDNAWGLLALLSWSEAWWLGASAQWRFRRVIENGAKAVEDALLRSAPRSEISRWRVLPSDLSKLRLEENLVLSGLASGDPGINVPYLPERDPLEAYVSEGDLRALSHRLKPSEDSANPNLLLRVPVHPWVLAHGPVAPPSVVAADLLEHPDARVARAGRQILRGLVDGHQDS
jgi:excisionase family DNA binding protein